MCPKRFLLILLLFQATLTSAQTSLRGTLRNLLTGKPIAGASVFGVEADSAGRFLAATDSLGRFSVQTTGAALLRLRISSVGYETLHVLPEPARLDSLYLVPASNKLGEVFIHADVSVSTSSAGNPVIRVAENGSLAVTANFLETLKRIPGIAVDGENSISMANGVVPQVFVDGKPLQLSGTELINYLRGLSPEQVLAVELIANPPAKYDGEFKAIIDIRLKKIRDIGHAGSYQAQVEQNTYSAIYQALNLSVTGGKLQSFTTLNHSGGRTIYRYSAFQHLPNTNFMTTRLNQADRQNTFNLQTGLDYPINARHKIGAQLRYYRPDNRRDRAGSILATDAENQQVVFRYRNSNPLHYRQKNLATTANYELNTGKFQLNLLATRLSVRNFQDDVFENRNTQNNERLDYWESDLGNRFQINSAQADLSGTLAGVRMEGGVKRIDSRSDNHLRFDVWNKTDGSISFDPARSNEFEYTEKISAGYLSFAKKAGAFNLNAGIRAEQTRSLSNSITLDSVVRNNYLLWLPSLGANYRLDANQDLSFSFSGRLTRPTFSQLNPFRSYFSVFNYWIGNPYLLPARRQQFKINYRFKRILAETNFGIERDVLARYPVYDATKNEIAFKGANFPKNSFAQLTVSAPADLASWWQLNYQLSAYYNKVTTPYLDEVFRVNVINYVSRLNQTFSLSKKTTLNVLFNYESRSGNSLYVFKPQWNLDVNAQKSGLDGKLTAKLAFLDLFNTYTQYLVFRRKDILNNELSHWWGMRKVQFVVSYAFGNTTQKTRRTVVSDEEARTR